jgi:hypothetical protein
MSNKKIAPKGQGSPDTDVFAYKASVFFISTLASAYMLGLAEISPFSIFMEYIESLVNKTIAGISIIAISIYFYQLWNRFRVDLLRFLLGPTILSLVFLFFVFLSSLAIGVKSYTDGVKDGPFLLQTSMFPDGERWSVEILARGSVSKARNKLLLKIDQFSASVNKVYFPTETQLGIKPGTQIISLTELEFNVCYHDGNGFSSFRSVRPSTGLHLIMKNISKGDIVNFENRSFEILSEIPFDAQNSWLCASLWMEMKCTKDECLSDRARDLINQSPAYEDAYRRIFGYVPAHSEFYLDGRYKGIDKF